MSSSLHSVLLDHPYGVVQVEDIKKEVGTKDEEVENISDLHGVPLVAFKVEALEDMKIEHDKRDKYVENSFFLMEPKTEVKEESDDAPDPMVDTPTEEEKRFFVVLHFLNCYVEEIVLNRPIPIWGPLGTPPQRLNFI